MSQPTRERRAALLVLVLLQLVAFGHVRGVRTIRDPAQQKLSGTSAWKAAQHAAASSPVASNKTAAPKLVHLKTPSPAVSSKPAAPKLVHLQTPSPVVSSKPAAPKLVHLQTPSPVVSGKASAPQLDVKQQLNTTQGRSPAAKQPAVAHKLVDPHVQISVASMRESSMQQTSKQQNSTTQGKAPAGTKSADPPVVVSMSSTKDSPAKATSKGSAGKPAAPQPPANPPVLISVASINGAPTNVTSKQSPAVTQGKAPPAPKSSDPAGVISVASIREAPPTPTSQQPARASPSKTPVAAKPAGPRAPAVPAVAPPVVPDAPAPPKVASKQPANPTKVTSKETAEKTPATQAPATPAVTSKQSAEDTSKKATIQIGKPTAGKPSLTPTTRATPAAAPPMVPYGTAPAKAASKQPEDTPPAKAPATQKASGATSPAVPAVAPPMVPAAPAPAKAGDKQPAATTPAKAPAAQKATGGSKQPEDTSAGKAPATQKASGATSPTVPAVAPPMVPDAPAPAKAGDKQPAATTPAKAPAAQKATGGSKQAEDTSAGKAPAAEKTTGAMPPTVPAVAPPMVSDAPAPAKAGDKQSAATTPSKAPAAQKATDGSKEAAETTPGKAPAAQKPAGAQAPASPEAAPPMVSSPAAPAKAGSKQPADTTKVTSKQPMDNTQSSKGSTDTVQGSKQPADTTKVTSKQPEGNAQGSKGSTDTVQGSKQPADTTKVISKQPTDTTQGSKGSADSQGSKQPADTPRGSKQPADTPRGSKQPADTTQGSKGSAEKPAAPQPPAIPPVLISVASVQGAPTNVTSKQSPGATQAKSPAVEKAADPLAVTKVTPSKDAPAQVTSVQPEVGDSSVPAPPVISKLDPRTMAWDGRIWDNYIPWQKATPFPGDIPVPKAVADYQKKHPPLTPAYCDGFSNAVRKELCLNYTTAISSEDRSCAGQTWRGTDPASYFCAGLTSACVSQELINAQKGVQPFRICTPLAEGARCALEAPRYAAMMPVCSKRLCTTSWGPLLPLSIPERPVASNPMTAGQVYTKLVDPPSRLFSWNSEVETFSVKIDTRIKGKEVPRGFLGTSHEWNRIQDYGEGNVEAWARIWKQLGPNNILRIGGASQDFMRAVPPPRQWKALVKLHQMVGAKFIIGVPLYGDNIPLTKAVMKAAQEHLGSIGALEAIELGNEPMYWQCPRVGGWDEKGQFMPGWGAYAKYFHRVASNISGCADGATGDKVTQLMGPAWDNLNTMPPDRIRQVLSAGKCYLQSVSIHYYPYYTKGAFDPHVLVSEDLMREAVRNVTQALRTIEPFGYKLRISEANSLSGGGAAGTSDSFAAALWTADFAFEFAQAGVESIHLHWGTGGSPKAEEVETGGAPDYTGVKTHFCNNDTTSCPSPRVVWYGYQLFQRAVSPIAAGEDTISDGSPAKFLLVEKAAGTKGCYGAVKVWPVMHQSDTEGVEELRIAVLNKNDEADCQVTLELTGVFGEGTVTRLTPGPNLLLSKGSARFGGQSYRGYEGRLSGTRVYEKVAAAHKARGKLQKLLVDADTTEYTMDVPKASALLLVAQTAKRPAA